MFTHMHLIVGVAIVYHALGYRCRRVFHIRQDADLCCLLYQRLVELRPRTTCQRDDTHVVVGHHETVRQQL